MKCPYCGSIAELVSSTKVYRGRDYGMILCCSNWPRCDSYVGVNPQGKPLGRMANAKLRMWKIKAHAAFDPLWRAKMEREHCSKKLAKGKGYGWLAERLGIPPQECHIGMFDVETCQKVVELCSPYRRKRC